MNTTKQRRKYTSEYKAKVALYAIKEQETLSSLSKKFGVHSNQIIKWKKEFLSNISAPFDKHNEI